MEDCSIDERLQQETLCCRQWTSATDKYIECSETLMRQNIGVVWLQCLLVNIAHHTVCWHQTMLPFVCQDSDLVGDPLRSVQPVKSAQQWADVVEPQQEYQLRLSPYTY